jgi:hypothetical protein
MTGQIRFFIEPDDEQLFEDFKRLAVVRGKTVPGAYTEIVRREVEAYRGLLDGEWLTWNELEQKMREAGFTVNRTTIWNYRKTKGFENLIATNGNATLYNLAGFLKMYRGEAQTV